MGKHHLVSCDPWGMSCPEDGHEISFLDLHIFFRFNSSSHSPISLIAHAEGKNMSAIKKVVVNFKAVAKPPFRR